jgi:hypothetical protein
MIKIYNTIQQIKTNKMKKITLGLGLVLLNAFSFAQAGLDSIIVEKYYVSTAADTVGGGSGTLDHGVLPVGSVTYRVFVDLAQGWKFQALYGEVSGAATHSLVVNTTTSFFNNQDRGATSANAIGSSYLKTNTVALDSWFSAGGAGSAQLGILKSEDNGVNNYVHTGRSGAGNAGLLTNTVIAIPLTTQDGMIAGTPEPVTFAGVASELSVFDATSQSGNSFSTAGGAVASGNGGSKGPDSATFNRVLVGQFTTNGVFHFELNVQIKDGVGGTVQNWVASNPQSSNPHSPQNPEYTHASLMYTSPTVSIPGNVSPTVSITTPTVSASYVTGATVAIAATAIDSDGIVDSVTFYVDGIRIGKDQSSAYTINWVSTVGTHTITAKATDDQGAYTTSSAVIISVGTVGINSVNASSLFTVYPNPANDVINLDITTSEQLTNAVYSVYDVIGNVILTKKIGSIIGAYHEVIDVTTLAKGMYIIKMSSVELTSTKKVIVN